MRHPTRSVSADRARATAQLLAFVVALAATSAPALGEDTGGRRFYLTGDGELTMEHAHLGEKLDVRYRLADGRYDPAALADIQRFFRSRTDGKGAPVSLRLVELIDYTQDRFQPSSLILISGYRSPELNASLRQRGGRVAKASLHTEGLAADVGFRGLGLRRLWRQLRDLGFGGVGLYERDGFLHLDAGKPRFWEPATSGVEKNLSSDNARLFARTDFDRYRDLEGAVVRLHAVTMLPVRIHREARLGGRKVALAPLGAVRAEGDCLVIEEEAAAYELAVSAPAAPPERRAPLELSTCAPRIGATPREIATNPIEGL